MNYELDKNGKVKVSGDLEKSLDNYYDNDDFEGIVKTILDIPRDIWCTELNFRLISAYNNLEQFDKANEELRIVEPSCVTPSEVSSLYYLNGYIAYRNDKEMMAISYYNKGKAADPENTGDHDFDDYIKDCEEYLTDELKRLRRLAVRVDADIRANFSAKPESEKLDPNEEVFTMMLGYLSGIRMIPGTKRALLFDEYFLKLKGEEKQAALNMLEGFYGIRDRESFKEFFTKSTNCNLVMLYNDIPPYLAGTPSFDVSQLNDVGREAFMNAARFMEPFVKFLPKAGVLAWDICEKVGLARLAYACDLISNTDYCTIMIMLTDQARESFSSFEEYIRSLAFGCGVYMFHTDQWAIVDAIKFIETMMPFLLNGDLPEYKWLSEEKH